MDEDKLFALVSSLSSRLTMVEVAIAALARHLGTGDALATDLAALRDQARRGGVALDDTRLIDMLAARPALQRRDALQGGDGEGM